MASPSSSSSSSSSSMHPASLVDPSVHSPHTLRLVSIKISKQLIDHVVDQVVQTVDYAMGKSPSPRSRPRTPSQLKFTTFVTTVLSRAEITTPTLLCSLLYITRARPYLHIALEEWALERVFLGALITASKYLNDSTLKNVHWALCTGVFGKRDVGRIEREFLAVLDWELGVSENEILSLWESLEWAVDMEDAEERRLQAKKRLAATPPKPRNHHRRSNVSASHSIAVALPQLTHSSSPSSSSSSSDSDSSSPRTPDTPTDFDLGYPEPEELARIQKAAAEQHDDMDVDMDVHHVSVVPAAKRSCKKSFGATTMDILKSFPFPGHNHHHHHHSQQQDSQHRRS